MKLLGYCMVILLPTLVFARSPQKMPALLVWPTMAVSKQKQKHLVQQTQVSMRCSLVSYHYITKSILAALLKQKAAHWLTKQGSVQMIAQTHQFSICDDERHRQRLLTLLSQLNQPPKQIHIRARIVSIDRQYLRDLGVQFSSLTRQDKAEGSSNDNPDGGDLSSHGLRIVLATINAQQLLAMRLHALVQRGHAQIIASPSLLASDGHAATIESGEEVPYQQGTLSGATSVAFKKAVMQLSVTPQIIQHQHVILNLKVHQDKVTPTSVNGVPIISTEQMQTSAIIHNNTTLVIGGIIEKQISDTIQGVPGLQHLPVLGLLFKHHHKEIKSRELLIFIHPKWDR